MFFIRCSAPTVLPLLERYLIVLVGRVKLRYIPIYILYYEPSNL